MRSFSVCCDDDHILKTVILAICGEFSSLTAGLDLNLAKELFSDPAQARTIALDWINRSVTKKDPNSNEAHVKEPVKNGVVIITPSGVSIKFKLDSEKRFIEIDFGRDSERGALSILDTIATLASNAQIIERWSILDAPTRKLLFEARVKELAGLSSELRKRGFFAQRRAETLIVRSKVTAESVAERQNVGE